ncbi:(E)-4-hydroxy-3-methylbut-2-enyl-diphosphate synthase [Cephaloticoccus primus]|uniref:(E)-4-hydroxy-3-methylbut-2-enyl-diphosphate synthase n=1 Tax=Cephaloticoccus primus TaxID=1548207 RepID=UPI000A818095|nr:(E)-4-hydroxy-3-methylbut-2-enyl-diphosphate synthase [Cephaloticoccus primus]
MSKTPSGDASHAGALPTEDAPPANSWRRRSREVRVGPVGIGGANPLRIQSMTTSDTQDVAATVRQAIALAEVGCEIVRITAPNPAAARCLGPIRKEFSAAGFSEIPLVADIHFLPSAAMEAVEHVEKVRVNPGNYADKKKFAVKEYSDAEYEQELQRLHDAFSPLVRRARELGRALRIGTNHGSLSDRIMNRYGDTPLGMVESALEFLRIAEAHGFRENVLSMKASSPKVMIQAYRLLVQRMAQEGMHYPLHLGVTEAGDGEDGRIKSAIGIGTLLSEGLGDTIRVSLTEDSVYEIPVARALAHKAAQLWRQPRPVVFARGAEALGSDVAEQKAENGAAERAHAADSPAPNFEEAPTRRETTECALGGGIKIGGGQVPAVIVRVAEVAALAAICGAFAAARLADTPVEGLLVPLTNAATLANDLAAINDAVRRAACGFAVLELAPEITAARLGDALRDSPLPRGCVLLLEFDAKEAAELAAFAQIARERGLVLAIATRPHAIPSLSETLRPLAEAQPLLFTLAATTPDNSSHALADYRALAEALRNAAPHAPIWIRNTGTTAVLPKPDFLSRLLDAATLSGALLCDGIGDMISVETEPDPVRALKLAYNVLQGAGARTTKTEFVACPSCGRTLFDLQSTTQRIREKTGHLKGVKLAIMGCIVNGPGEMADADFGYVGGAPGKINLYVGKQCIRYNIPQAEADDRLIELIKEHGKWTEPPEPAAVPEAGAALEVGAATAR